MKPSYAQAKKIIEDMERRRTELYDEIVCDGASKICRTITLNDAAMEIVNGLGADPAAVLEEIREGAYEGIKECLRPIYYQKLRELGLADG